MGIVCADEYGARAATTGLNATALAEAAALGADATVPLTEDWDADQKAFEGHFFRWVDVVVDYLWGSSARHLLIAASKAGRDEAPPRFDRKSLCRVRCCAPRPSN